MKEVKEKLVGIAGSVSGVTSVLSSWQICHNICLGLVFLLSLMGITLVAMPLQFLTRFSVPLWSIAFVFLMITLVLFFRKGCIAKHLVLLNTGLVVASVPFQIVQPVILFFWVMGGLIVCMGIITYVHEKLKHRKHRGDVQ